MYWIPVQYFHINKYSDHINPFVTLLLWLSLRITAYQNSIPLSEKHMQYLFPGIWFLQEETLIFLCTEAFVNTFLAAPLLAVFHFHPTLITLYLCIFSPCTDLESSWPDQTAFRNKVSLGSQKCPTPLLSNSDFPYPLEHVCPLWFCLNTSWASEEKHV